MSHYDGNPSRPTRHSHDYFLDPHNTAAGNPTDLAAAIAGTTTSTTHADRAQLVVTRAPGQAIADRLRELDGNYESYQSMVPSGAELTVDLLEITAWQQADEQMRDAREIALAGAQKIRTAVTDDERNAYIAVSEGKKIPPATVSVVEDAALESVRRYGALMAIASERIADLRDALRHHWRAGWRTQLVEQIEAAQARAITEHSRFVGALHNLLAARTALVVVDQKYGSANYEGEMMPSPERGEDGWMNPPKWNHTSVKQLLRNDLASLNRVPLNPRLDDMRAVEAFVRSRLVHEEWQPGNEPE